MRIIVAAAAGGAADIQARLFGQWLSDRLGQQFIVDKSTGCRQQCWYGGGRARTCGRLHWAELNRETQLHELAVTGGVVSTTGIAGLTRLPSKRAPRTVLFGQQ